MNRPRAAWPTARRAAAVLWLLAITALGLVLIITGHRAVGVGVLVVGILLVLVWRYRPTELSPQPPASGPRSRPGADSR